jgi:alkylated DNA repair protein (DNA oxidative demethylase)
MMLFEPTSHPLIRLEALGAGTAILEGFALEVESTLRESIECISQVAPFRHLETPGGYRMSVAMTNCGPLGWTSDRTGYRYDALDPHTGKQWPGMPPAFLRLADSAAEAAGFHGFRPDACLINRYEPGAKLSLHQDKDEGDLSQPIVSVSLGLPATFLFGGLKRADKTVRVQVVNGDVVVWGGPARMRYHAVAPLKSGDHPVFGGFRYNLTFRKAGAAA